MTDPPGATLDLRGLARGFDGRSVLDPLTLSAPAGQFLAVLGPSGCGKSTLLRLVAGLLPGSAGEVAVGGIAPEGMTREGQVGFVFQDPHLLPWRSALANAALPLELRGVAKQERQERAAAVLGSVGLSDALERYPGELSGGMRMRVSLARALVTQPRLLLLDEPFAALDELTRLRLDLQLLELWREQAPTVVFVTHSIAEAVFLAERVLVLSARPARVVADLEIPLPPERDGALRGTAAFAEQVGRLQAALEAGAA